jgi:uroporphyrinogen III methyltransferase/synthase
VTWSGHAGTGASGGQPLAGRRILVTRRAEQASELTRRLREYGASVVEVPMIRIGPPTDLEAPRHALEGFADYDYVVFTSVNAVAAVKMLADRMGIDLSGPGPVVFAVGPTTASAVEGAGLSAEALGEEFTADGLARALESRPMSERRVLVPRSEVGGDVLPTALRRRGAHVDDVAVYLTEPDPRAPERLAEVLEELDVVTFASGSSVAGFGAAVPPDWQRPDDLHVAVIGPAAASAATVAGLEPDIVASEHTSRGLADAIAAYFQRT